MEYIRSESLTNFKFWSGAADRAKQLTYDELEQLDSVLPDFFGGETPTETAINDLFWFEFGSVCELIGLRVDDNDDIVRE